MVKQKKALESDAPSLEGGVEHPVWKNLQQFFSKHPLEELQTSLWELYRGWAYNSKDLGTHKKTSDMLCLYEKLIQFFDICYMNVEKQAIMSMCQAKVNEVAGVKEIVAFLAETIQPSKIFLLNSQPVTTDDGAVYIDLMIILPYRNHILFQEHEALVEFVNLRNRHVICSLHRLDTVNEALLKGHIFYSLSCTQDNLIYDTCKHDLPATPEALFPQIRKIARREFDQNFNRAQAFYESAVLYNSFKNKVLVPFMLHQAAELTFRAILLSLIGKEKRTHCIKTLIKYSRRCAPQLNSIFPRDTEPEKLLVHMLDEAYLKARYESDFFIEESILDVLFARIKQLQTLAKQVFEDKISKFEV